MNYLLTNQSSNRLIYRDFSQDDFDLWLPFFQDENSLRFLFFDKDLSPEQLCQNWINKLMGRYRDNTGGLNVLIEKETGDFVGQVGLLVQEVNGKKELEIGYHLLPEHRGKGYATEAAIKCKEFAFQNDLCESLISIVHVDNHASANVAQKNGMRIDFSTIYKGIPVNIFRIKKSTFEETSALIP